MGYYLVNCYIGHCGCGRAPRDVALAIEARDMISALRKAKHLPGVKHNASKYLLSAKEITREEYLLRRETNPYEKALRF